MPSARPHLEAVTRSSLPRRLGQLRLDMNENPDGLPREFLQKILARIDPDGLATYPEYDELESRLAVHHGLPPDRIVLGNGSDGIIRDLFTAYVAPGDGVLIAEPSFAMYKVYAQVYAARIESVDYCADRSFPIDRFIDHIGPGLRLAIVVNPNNPTGTAIPSDSLEMILERCEAHDVLLIVDEAYVQFHGRTIIGRASSSSNLVVLRTFSKLCAIASARLGYAACAPSIALDVRKVRPTYDVNGLAVMFGNAILDSPGVLERIHESIEDGRKWLTSRLRESEIGRLDTIGNFVLIRCGGRACDIVRELATAGILVKGGFPQPYLREYIRVTLGSVPTMQRFWSEFTRIWERPDQGLCPAGTP